MVDQVAVHGVVGIAITYVAGGFDVKVLHGGAREVVVGMEVG